jgi:cell division control protein 11
MCADMHESQRARGRNKVKKGLTFTLMVVGSSGTGKTTFVNTLCAKPVLEHKEADDPEHAHVEHGVRIKPVTVGISIKFFFDVDGKISRKKAHVLL